MSKSKPESVNVGDEDKDSSATSSIDLDMNVSGSSSRREMYERAREILAQTEHLSWKTPRYPKNQYVASSSIVSSSSDEPTIDLNKPNAQCNFNPTEITGRSTATNDASMSVEQILGESNISDVRALADELRFFKFRESRGGEQLAYTADVSLTSSKSFRSSMSKPDDWDLNNRNDINGSDVFMPSDRVKDFLKNEEALWAQEYATLPPEPDSQSNGSRMKKGFDMSESLRSRFGNEFETESNASFGQFFNKRSDNVAEMLPNSSPTKEGRPLALVDSVNSTQENLNTGDEMKVGAQSMYLPNTTTAKDGESFISHTAIESFFKKCRDDSPQTVSHKLMNLKKAKPASQFIHESAVKPLPEVPYVTEPIPFKPHNTNSNVKILKVEKFYGDVAALLERPLNSGIPLRSTFLTPGGHIRKIDSNKENEVDPLHDENIREQNLSSDTLSMSGLVLSSSKVQGSSTKSSRDDDFIDSAADAANDVNQNNTENDEITPDNSPQRNRKRTRSNSNTPFRTPNSVDVLYNPKHRLTPSPRMQSNNTTPDTPKSNSNLAVLYNPKHRLTPSPNRSKNGTIQSTNSTPVTPVASFLNSNNGRSTYFMDPINTNMRTFDVNLKSPKLLTQSNSQFSSVSDLREFSIKSSHSVISWPSQKLRTPSMKQFTIKNIGGKKLTMKIEVIGPGFQLSPSEPFQLIALQAQECRTISVTFCPTALGAAIGKLNFCHAKDTADKTIRKIIPLFGYGGHTVVEVQGVSQGVVGNPFLQLGTVGDLLNLQMYGTFSVYNKGPLRGVAIIRVKSDLKKPANYSALTITPSKCVIGPDSHTRIDIVYRPRKNDVKKLLRQEGNVLGVATLEVFMADEPSRQRILGLINKFANNSSEMYLLDDLFRGISTDVVENLAEFQESEEMIAELFNKMKSTEIVLTVKRSTMDQTIESEHDFFMSDTNESMFFHTLVSDDVCPPPAFPAPTNNVAAVNIGPSLSTIPVASQRLQQRIQADKWFLDKAEIKLNPYNVDRASSQINIHSQCRSQQLFEVYSNHPEMFIIEPECGIISPGNITTVNVTIKNTILPSEGMYIRIRIDKKQDAVLPVIIDK